MGDKWWDVSLITPIVFSKPQWVNALKGTPLPFAFLMLTDMVCLRIGLHPRTCILQELGNKASLREINASSRDFRLRSGNMQANLTLLSVCTIIDVYLFILTTQYSNCHKNMIILFNMQENICIFWNISPFGFSLVINKTNDLHTKTEFQH